MNAKRNDRHPPLFTFLISDFVLQGKKRFFASVIKIISGSISQMSERWFPWQPPHKSKGLFFRHNGLRNSPLTFRGNIR